MRHKQPHFLREPLVVVGRNTKAWPGDVATNNLYVFQSLKVETVFAEGTAHPFHTLGRRRASYQADDLSTLSSAQQFVE
jgi:hypothetical protein